MKTAFTQYIESLERMAEESGNDSMAVSLRWHAQDMKKFEKYTQLIRAVEPELHRNALLYSGMIDPDDED